MAQIQQQIDPLDLTPSTGVGVALPFNGPGVFNINYTTNDQIKSNLVNYFLTNNGERYLNPGFGGNLRATLFEAISNNNLDNLETQIKDQLSNLFPNVKVINLTINSLPDQNLISINLSYRVLNQDPDDIQINFTSDAI